MTNKTNKIARIIACLLIPILWPVRLVVKTAKYVLLKWNKHRYPKRIEKAKQKAIERSRQTKRRQYAISCGHRIHIYERMDMRRMTKIGRKAGLGDIDFRLLTLFTCENGRIIEK